MKKAVGFGLVVALGILAYGVFSKESGGSKYLLSESPKTKALNNPNHDCVWDDKEVVATKGKIEVPGFPVTLSANLDFIQLEGGTLRRVKGVMEMPECFLRGRCTGDLQKLSYVSQTGSPFYKAFFHLNSENVYLEEKFDPVIIESDEVYNRIVVTPSEKSSYMQQHSMGRIGQGFEIILGEPTTLRRWVPGIDEKKFRGVTDVYGENQGIDLLVDMIVGGAQDLVERCRKPGSVLPVDPKDLMKKKRLDELLKNSEEKKFIPDADGFERL